MRTRYRLYRLMGHSRLIAFVAALGGRRFVPAPSVTAWMDR